FPLVKLQQFVQLRRDQQHRVSFLGRNPTQWLWASWTEAQLRGSVTNIKIRNVTYRVLDVNPKTQILKISREDYLTGICSPELVNTTLDPTLFDYGAPGYQNLTLAYGCASSWLPLPGQLSCPTSGDVQVELGAHGPNEECNVSVVVAVLLSNPLLTLVLSELERVIREGFDVEWKVDTAACRDCMTDCGYNLKLNRPICYFSPSKPGLQEKPILLCAQLSETI
ncbi:LEAF RUST 10 DISEASE-RESISTANCE LOCUS RECEPTOR-LIKE PROTEIN KINASE-like 1.3, partial [Alnus glutinosa]|uniref:LEAF RUST 10 DISEASE-RESISTANCE LOCUS RECEPTOR-LIKE PROTEIN KINASE-like 1.3 n=1 Tax=Alnus glutinosa TaxID=3517 RepID=UPI002D796506